MKNAKVEGMRFFFVWLMGAVMCAAQGQIGDARSILNGGDWKKLGHLQKMPQVGTYSQGDVSFPYHLHFPVQMKVGQKYPLILQLHGSGACGTDNKKTIHEYYMMLRTLNRPDMQEQFPCFVLVPQSTGAWTGQRKLQSPDATQAPLPNAVIAFIRELAKTQPIDLKRIYVTGLSLGGVGTWTFLDCSPDFFAAGAPLCGFYFNHEQTARRLKDKPVWIFHGQLDKNVPVKRGRDMFNAMRAAGAVKLRYTEYPLVPHYVWVVAYADPSFYEWLFAQKLED